MRENTTKKGRISSALLKAQAPRVNCDAYSRCPGKLRGISRLYCVVDRFPVLLPLNLIFAVSMILCLAVIGMYRAVRHCNVPRCASWKGQDTHKTSLIFPFWAMFAEKRKEDGPPERELASIAPAMMCALWHMVVAPRRLHASPLFGPERLLVLDPHWPHRDRIGSGEGRADTSPLVQKQMFGPMEVVQLPKLHVVRVLARPSSL